MYLLGYFGQEGYKLLERETGAVFQSCNVIFKEETTNFTMPLSQLLDNNETSTPIYLETPQDQSNGVEQPLLTNKTNTHSIIDGNRQETAPRPMQMAELHTGDQNSRQ